MIHILLATLASAMQCRPHSGQGRATALVAFERTYRFSGGTCVSEGIHRRVTGWLNLGQLTSRGMCRTILCFGAIATGKASCLLNSCGFHSHYRSTPVRSALEDVV